MALPAGHRLGPYQIVSLVGAGGMGEVYSAKDTRLERTVAVKILSTAIDSPSAREQFEREARAISSLTGPHICALYDVGTQDGRAYLVMEFLEGETLAHRLSGGPLPLKKAIEYAIQIAQALDQVHRQGLIHRDLKPSNIMLTKSGVKLLDFGLARMARNPEWLAGPAEKTITLTTPGPLLGTCQYVAPELFDGKKPDSRCDIFAFGAVLYEMITGRRAFEGKTQAVTIANILEHEPPAMVPDSPVGSKLSALEHLVRTCLVKDPEERRQTAHDILLELRWLAETETPTLADQGSGGLRVKPLWIAGASVLFAVLLALALTLGRRATPKLPLQRVSILPAEDTAIVAESVPAISPNGRRVVFSATKDGKRRLWVRDVDAAAAWAVPGTESGYGPFWSPNNDEVAYFGAGKLRKVKLTGVPPVILCDALQGRGGTWNRDGVIVFTPNTTNGIYRVSSQGGKPEPVTTLDASQGETSHRWPWFLPDGRHFLLTSRSTEANKTALFVGDLDSQKRVRVHGTESNAMYSPPGYLLFIHQHTLMAEPFDAARLTTTGEPFQVANQVELIAANLQASFSASETGALAYYTGNGSLLNNQMTWFDRSGNKIGTIGEEGTFLKPAISPDGRTMMADRLDSQTGSYDLWLYDLARGTSTRLTFDSRQNSYPVWSPDGASVAFASNRNGHYQIYRISVTGGKEEVLLESPQDKFPADWSRDGKYLVYYLIDPATKYDLWAMPLTGDRKPFPLLTSPFNEQRPTLSPDARWLAYSSDETGTDEIYVQSFPSMERKWKVSVGGGTRPVWTRDGKELFYIASDRRLMVAAVRAGADFRTEAPRALFTVRQNLTRFFDLSLDGSKVVLVDPVPDSPPPAVNLVLNWNSGR